MSTSSPRTPAVRHLVRKIQVVVGALIAVSAVPSDAQQHCAPGANLSSPSSRFVDHGDGTVSDTRSKLMWMRCSAGQTWTDGHCVGDASRLDFQSAQAIAADLNRSGRLFFNDWRVPQLRELASITERECVNPRVNLAIFPDTPAGSYWTATARPTQGSEPVGYVLGFGAQGVRYVSRNAANEDPIHVRLVRSDL